MIVGLTREDIEILLNTLDCVEQEATRDQDLSKQRKIRNFLQDCLKDIMEDCK